MDLLKLPGYFYLFINIHIFFRRNFLINISNRKIFKLKSEDRNRVGINAIR